MPWGQRVGSAFKSGFCDVQCRKSYGFAWHNGQSSGGISSATVENKVEEWLWLGKMCGGLCVCHLSTSCICFVVVNAMFLTEWRVEGAPAAVVSQHQHREGSWQWWKQFWGVPNLTLSTYPTSSASVREKGGDRARALIDNCAPSPWVLPGLCLTSLANRLMIGPYSCLIYIHLPSQSGSI